MTESLDVRTFKKIGDMNKAMAANSVIFKELDDHSPIKQIGNAKKESEEKRLQDEGVNFKFPDITLSGAVIRKDINPLDFAANLNTAIVLSDNVQKLVQADHALQDNLIRLKASLQTMQDEVGLGNDLIARTIYQRQNITMQCERVIAELLQYTKASRVGLKTLLDISDARQPNPRLTDFQNLKESLHRLREHYREKETKISDHIIPVSLKFAKKKDGAYIITDNQLNLDSTGRHGASTYFKNEKTSFSIDLSECQTFTNILSDTDILWIRDIGAQVHLESASQTPTAIDTLSLSIKPTGGVKLKGVANIGHHVGQKMLLTGCLNTNAEAKPTWSGSPSIIGFSPTRKWELNLHADSLLSSPLRGSESTGKLLDVTLYFHVMRYSPSGD